MPRPHHCRRNPLRRAGLIAATAVASACAAVPAQPRLPPAALPGSLVPVRDSILRLVESGAVPSAGIAVVKDGRVIMAEAFGWADRERRIAATDRTVYQVASLTKPITATGVMVLAERGILRLDRPVGDYLGGPRVTSRAGGAEGVTLERLLTHTAGMPAFWSDYFADEPHAPPTAEEVVRRYAFTVFGPGEASTVFKPGVAQRSVYSNLGFQLLGLAIGNASGRGYETFMRDSVFLPLGMTSTGFDPAAIPDSLLAVGYDAEGRPFPRFTTASPAAGAARSSIGDLARFMLLHLGDAPPDARVLHDTTVREMQRARMAANPPFLRQALAWLVTEYEDGYREVSHSGAMQGAAAWMALYPRERLGVVVVINQQKPQIALELAGLAAGAVEPALKERLSWQLALLSGEQPPNAPPQQLRAERPPLRGRFAGFIHAPPGDSIPLRLLFGDDGAIHACLANQPEVPVRDGRFPGKLDLPETRRSPHEITIRLDRRPTEADPLRLTGQVTALSTHPRSHFNLPFWVELHRISAPPAGARGC